jgi:hypothetical protein
MKAVCLVILAVLLSSACTTTRQPFVSASDWSSGGKYAERSGTCIDPDQR